jgi:hypothetical protein
MKARTLSCIALLALAACAGTGTLSEAERRSIQTVSIAPEVAMPAYAQVVGPEVNKGYWLGGPIAMAVMMNSENADSVKFKQHLADGGIDVRAIVRDEFAGQLAALKVFGVVPEGGQARFELAVEGYGLAPGFSMRAVDKPVRPVLRVAAKLNGAEGKVLWQGSAYITGMSDLPAYQIDDYYANPERTREQFVKAAGLVVKELLVALQAP